MDRSGVANRDAVRRRPARDVVEERRLSLGWRWNRSDLPGLTVPHGGGSPPGVKVALQVHPEVADRNAVRLRRARDTDELGVPRALRPGHRGDRPGLASPPLGEARGAAPGGGEGAGAGGTGPRR